MVMSWRRIPPSLVLDHSHCYAALPVVVSEAALVWLSKWRREKVIFLLTCEATMKNKSKFYRPERLCWQHRIQRTASQYLTCLWGVKKALRYVVLPQQRVVEYRFGIQMNVINCWVFSLCERFISWFSPRLYRYGTHVDPSKVMRDRRHWRNPTVMETYSLVYLRISWIPEFLIRSPKI